MSEIGHNSPPPFEAHSLHIEDLFALASGSTAGTVSTDEQETALDSLLNDLREAKKAADAERAAEKAPYDEASKAVQSKWKPLLDRCDAAINEVKERLTPYRAAKQKAKEEAAQKARAEAAAKEEAARKALRDPDDLEAKFAAEEELKRARKLTAVANRADREATGLRAYWVAEITDRRAALNFMIQRSPERFEELIQQLADEEARGARGAIPGVIFQERKRAA